VERDSIVGARTSRVLLVDDERDLVELLAFLVEQAGFVPIRAVDPGEALGALEREDPAVAVVDLNLSSSSGFDLIFEIRRRKPKIPIIVLTARGSEGDKVRALDMGADDYVVKPFAHRELIARIRAQARRAEPGRDASGETALNVGGFHLDLQERTILVNGGAPLRLTGTEFRLLECLMRNADSVVGTEILARYVWGYNDPPAREAMRVTVYRLRRKLSDDAVHSRMIETIPGVGLRLRVLQPEQSTEPSL
jgi:DNA-binding response OmpR family regulator